MTEGYFISLLLVISALVGQTTPTSWFVRRPPFQGLGPSLFCNNIPHLSFTQRKLCLQYPGVLEKFEPGLERAVTECQHQFRSHKWNCSTFAHGRDTALFANFLLRDSKEVAFIHSIASAAVVHVLASTCRDGSLQDCNCDPGKTRGKSQDSNGVFDWSGCSNNIKFALKFTRLFIDAKDSQTRDARGLMNLHNNNLGRRAVAKHLELKCKCHGVSGSCSVRTCWKSLEEFAIVGDFLKSRYDKAARVGINQDMTGVLTHINSQRKAKKGTMVYMDTSADYCDPDPSTGSYGTKGRLCTTSNKAVGDERCEEMCCGRGYQTDRVQETISCDCKFKWCCYVECKTCGITKDESICN